MVHHNAGAPLEASQYPIDVLMFAGFVADPDDSQVEPVQIRSREKFLFIANNSMCLIALCK